MAISIPTPYAEAPDSVTMQEAAALFAECGSDRKVDAVTLTRWAVKHGVRLGRRGKFNVASWTDLIEVHAVETDRRESRGRRR